MDQELSYQELLQENRKLKAKVAKAQRMEAALKENEENYRHLSENLPVAVYSALPDKRSSSFFISGRMKELTGYPAEFFKTDASLFARIIHPEDVQSVNHGIRAALEKKKLIDIQYRIITKDNKVKWIRDRATPIFSNGSVLRIEGFMEDITASRCAKDALKAASRQWQDTFDAMSEALAILDINYHILQCNRAMQRLTGKSYSDIIGAKCWEIIHGMDIPIDQCPIIDVEKCFKQQSSVIQITDRFYEVEIDPHFNTQGDLTGFTYILSDISKRKCTESALREAHQTLLTVLDSIDATIYVADMQTYEILFMNRHMQDSFHGDLTGQKCWLAFHSESHPCPSCTNDSLLDAKGNPTGVYIWEGRNPVTGRWYVNYDRAIKWIDGRFVHLQVATDITAIKTMEKERLRTEEQLRKASKMEAIGTLAGGIAHDFNNILSAILGFTELIMDDALHDRISPNYIQEILRAGHRARDLVQQILTFSRQTESEAKPIQVKPIIKEALKLLRASLPSTIDIQTDIISEAIVKADPTQIHQVIMNLCANAGHAMRERGGTLFVQLKEEIIADDIIMQHPELKPGLNLKLMVRDTGHGIDRVIMEKIFDPYFTTKEMGEGTGMGLAVVQGIVRSCNGAIDVKSEVNRGTTFSVYLPIISQISLQKPTIRPMIKGGIEKILFVDDEPPLANLGKQLLERFGYQVTTRTSSTEALHLFQRNPDAFDLVITDMTMPHITGEELAQKMMALRPQIPIVICTGYSEKITHEMLERLSIKALIMKPLMRDELGLTIRQILDDAQANNPR